MNGPLLAILELGDELLKDRFGGVGDGIGKLFELVEVSPRVGLDEL